jgi:lysophospholipase L1-like esterase
VSVVGAARRWRRDRLNRQAADGVRALQAAWGDGLIPGGPRRVYVLGDSYAQGAFLDDPRRSWARTFAETTGATVQVDGLSGTGFVADGFVGDHSFDQRLARALAWAPDVLVVQGGNNDLLVPLGSVEVAAEALLTATSDRQVVVVGPAPMPARAGSALDDVDRTLGEVTKRSGAKYVQASRWAALTFMADDTHLTQAGHDLFGRQVAAALGA